MEADMSDKQASKRIEIAESDAPQLDTDLPRQHKRYDTLSLTYKRLATFWNFRHPLKKPTDNNHSHNQ